jgi:hypothetical protein
MLAARLDFLVKMLSRRMRAWRNGRRARLRIWFRKDWRFKSSRAHQQFQPKSALFSQRALPLWVVLFNIGTIVWWVVFWLVHNLVEIRNVKA